MDHPKSHDLYWIILICHNLSSCSPLKVAFFGISQIPGYPPFWSADTALAEVQIGPLATTQIPFSFCPPTMTQHTAEIALSATRSWIQKEELQLFAPLIHNFEIQLPLFELNTHIKSSDFRPFQLGPRIAAHVFAWHNIHNTLLKYWQLEAQVMKPNLSWSYRIQGVAEAPADPTLHTFTVPGHKISAMAMGSSHFSREMENQWKSARLLDIVGYDTLEIFYDFPWFSQRVSQVSWWVEMSEPRRSFVLLYLLWCARRLQQTAIISSTRNKVNTKRPSSELWGSSARIAADDLRSDVDWFGHHSWGQASGMLTESDRCPVAVVFSAMFSARSARHGDQLSCQLEVPPQHQAMAPWQFGHRISRLQVSWMRTYFNDFLMYFTKFHNIIYIYILSYHIISYYIISYHIILYYIIDIIL